MRVATAVLVAGIVGTLLLCGMHAAALISSQVGDPTIVLLAPGLLAYAGLGWTILAHRQGHRIGWVLLWTVPLVAVVFLGFTMPGLPVTRSLPEPLLAVAAWLAVVLVAPAMLLAVAALGLLFPDGRLPGPRWRRPVRAVIALTAASSLMLGFASGSLDPSLPPNPFALPFLPVELRGLGAALSPIAILAGTTLAIASMAVRIRRSRAVERQQMKWMLAALTVVGLLVMPGFVLSTPIWFALLGSLSLVLIPAAATVAILRYRLYEIDRLVSRTIGWAVVTGALAVGFAVPFLGLQAMVANVSGGETIVVAVATLIAAALFQPLRTRVQRAVDRRFDRARYDGERVVEVFGDRLREQVELDALIGEIRKVADETVRPAGTALWLRSGTNAPAHSSS